jgi:hypothetical protein
MPDTQGVTSFIGNFIKGYMGQMATQQDEKVKNVSALMDMAERYRKIAADPTATEEEYNEAQEMYKGKLQEADKVWNEKGSGLGQIMNILGLSKKGKNGKSPSLPRQLFKEEGGAPAGAQVGPVANATPAAMPRPASMGPEPSIGNENLPAEFRNLPPEFISAPGGQPVVTSTGQPVYGVGPIVGATGGAPPAKPPFIHPVIRAQLQAKALEDAQRLKSRLEEEEKAAEIRNRFSKEDFEWKQTQHEEEIQNAITRYRESPEFAIDDPGTQSRKISFIRDQIPYREPTPRLITKTTRDNEGRLVSQTREVNTPDQPIVSEVPAPYTEHEALVQAMRAEAKAKGVDMTPEQAEAEIGKIRLKGLRLGNEGKSAGLQAQADLHMYRTERQNFITAKNAAGGKMTPAQASTLYRTAIARGDANLQKYYKNKLIIMPQAQKDQITMDFARQYVEGMGGEEGIMNWDELVKIINPAKENVNPESAGRNYLNSGIQTSTKAAPKGKTYTFKK